MSDNTKIILIFSSVALTAFLVVASAISVNTRPGDGEKVGQIIKVERTGVIRKTWEGELVRGGMVNGSGAIGIKPFHFTIESDAEAAKAIEFMRQQTEVCLKYRTEFLFWPLRTSSDGTFLTEVAPSPK